MTVNCRLAIELVGSRAPLLLLLLPLLSLVDHHTQAQHHHHDRPQQVHRRKLAQPPPGAPIVQGPGVDLVALNRRRFESDHRHSLYGKSSRDLSQASESSRSADQLESQLTALPNQLMSRLPADLTAQLLETMSVDPNLVLANAAVSPADQVELLNHMRANEQQQQQQLAADDDPDGASIQRLTKSCLTVHASSASVDQLNVTFHLFTRANPLVPLIVRPQTGRRELLSSKLFDPRLPIKWITHGFHTNLDKSEWMLAAKDKILAHEEANVVLTDWRRGASPALAFYPKAAANAHVVAKMIVRILRRLSGDIDLSRVHLIGHSLGAHIMGFVGSAFTEEFLGEQQQRLAGGNSAGADQTDASLLGQAEGRLIGRITACDPALPCFGPSSSAPNPGQPSTTTIGPPPVSPSNQPMLGAIPPDPIQDWTPTMWTHLRPDSAMLVEVMHTNPGAMGYADPLGDYDFYPNGYDRQPGCGGGANQDTAGRQSRRTSRQASATASWSATLNRFIKPIKDFFHGYACSHHRSVEYMVESMYSESAASARRPDETRSVCQMVGYRCLDYESFKRGFCFQCDQPDDCRTFFMAGEADSGRSIAVAGALATKPVQLLARLRPVGSAAAAAIAPANQRQRRALPTLDQFKAQNHYRPVERSKYFLDTKPTGENGFCLHHYNLLIKYRWFRIRESFAVENFKLLGALGSFEQFVAPQATGAKWAPLNQLAFHRFTYQSYTMLLTSQDFLGPIAMLLVFGDNLRPTLIEHIQVTYMSNLEPRARSANSARLCRLAPASLDYQRLMNGELSGWPANATASAGVNLFVRCSSPMV